MPKNNICFFCLAVFFPAARYEAEYHRKTTENDAKPFHDTNPPEILSPRNTGVDKSCFLSIHVDDIKTRVI
jgi:hypothetical protein